MKNFKGISNFTLFQYINVIKDVSEAEVKLSLFKPKLNNHEDTWCQRFDYVKVNDSQVNVFVYQLEEGYDDIYMGQVRLIIVDSKGTIETAYLEDYQDIEDREFDHVVISHMLKVVDIK